VQEEKKEVTKMLKWFKQLDKILRGDATRLSLLTEGKIDIPIEGLPAVIILLGASYGLCMGSYAMIRTGGEAYMQMIASAVKMPLLFLLTLAVTFPSLYVFNALIGTRLSVLSALRLLIASLAVMLAVLASLGPIVVFFAVSTKSYPFMKLLNVATGTVSGVLGLGFLLQTLHRLVTVQEGAETPGRAANSQGDENPKSQEASDSSPAPPAKGGGPFALVGAQMSWVLRPFIGSPELPFEWFRQRQGNFFVAVLQALGNLFSS
jgi:hypothetical protein